jgi:hypothetical protein
MVKHKIQSTEKDGLQIDLKPVPKKLGDLRTIWNPNSFIISFKVIMIYSSDLIYIVGDR